jgi:hypothetical protein
LADAFGAIATAAPQTARVVAARATARKLNMEILSSGTTADWRSVGRTGNETLVPVPS